MKYVDFRKFTDENGAKPVYLFEGEEVYFREKGEALLKERFVAEPTLDYISFEGHTLKGEKIRALTDAVQCFPFISEKRFVRVTEFYPTEKEYELYLKPLFESPVQSAVLCISNAGKGKAGTATLAKLPNVTYVDCGKSDEETIKKWIYLTTKRGGVYTDGMTCSLIAQYCNYDMSRIAKETEKLLLYCEATGAERITDEIVEAQICPETEYKIYELTNAIARKNYAEYMKILLDLTGKTNDVVGALSMIANYFRTLYEVSVTQGSDKEAAVALGLKEFAVKKNREQAARFSTDALFSTYEATYRVISAIKCGEITPDAAVKTVTAKVFYGV